MHTRSRLALAALVAAGLAGGAITAGLAQEGGPALSPELTQAAVGYAAWTERAGALDGRFADGEAVRRSLMDAAPHDEISLVEGMIAFGALAALADPRFEEAARAAGPDFAQQLAAEPAAVLQLDGAQAAAGRVEAALARQAQGLAGAGVAVKAAAYSIQHQAWSRARVADPAARLAAVKALAMAPLGASDADPQALPAAFAADPPDAYPGAAPTGVVIDALALAAIAAAEGPYGRSGEEVAAVTRDRRSEDCLRLARLNLYQCLAVAGPQYEDVFCLGEHALGETGGCLAKAAGAGGGGMGATGADAIGALLSDPRLGTSRPAAWSPAPSTGY
ncbi:MAG TPA: hypothetical protein VGS12_13805 [Caulobacteraceae bacterium]|nr:hypothetical protein [Caulobacteraceae bacterium]